MDECTKCGSESSNIWEGLCFYCRIAEIRRLREENKKQEAGLEEIIATLENERHKDHANNIYIGSGIGHSEAVEIAKRLLREVE